MGVGRELSTRVATEVGAVVDSARGVALAVAAALADLCTEDRKSDTLYMYRLFCEQQRLVYCYRACALRGHYTCLRAHCRLTALTSVAIWKMTIDPMMSWMIPAMRSSTPACA